MKLIIKVTQTDGETFEVQTNLYVIVAWERKFKRKSSELATGAVGHEDLLFMAHEAAKLNNIPVPLTLDDFIKKVDDIDIVQVPVPPTGPASTEGN